MDPLFSVPGEGQYRPCISPLPAAPPVDCSVASAVLDGFLVEEWRSKLVWLMEFFRNSLNLRFSFNKDSTHPWNKCSNLDALLSKVSQKVG